MDYEREIGRGRRSKKEGQQGRAIRGEGDD